MTAPVMEKSIQTKIMDHRPELIASLHSAMESSISNEQLDDLLQRIINIYVNALFYPPSNDNNAGLAGELIVKELWVRPHQLAALLAHFSTFPLKILSRDEILSLQPRLFKVVADISNGYWREIFNAVHKPTMAESLEQKAESDILEKDIFPHTQKKFIPQLVQEFLETNQRLENEILEHQRARIALIDSERRYRTLAESATDYIFIINKDDQIEYLNQYAKMLFRSIEQTPTGMQRNSFFSASTSKRQRQSLQHVFETGVSQHRQDWTELDDGTLLFLDTHLVPLMEEGTVRAVLGISRDLTREKENDEKNLENEKKYHSLFDAIHNSIFLIDDGKIIDCNKASTEIFQMSKDELIGHDFASLFISDSDPRSQTKSIHKHLDRCTKGQNRNFELDYHLDDDILNFEIHLSFFSGTETPLVLAVIRNITPHKKATETIRASEKRFRDIITRSIDGYFFIDVNYRLKHYNPSAEKILTYSREELNELLFSKLHEDWNKKIHRVIKRAMGGATFEWEEFYFQDRHGVERWVAINVRRVYENGIVTGVEGFVKDISHRKNAEIELKESEARYKALFESTPYDVFGLTLERRFLKVNQNFQKNWGRVENKTLQNFRPKSLADLIIGLCNNVEDARKPHETTFSRSSNNQKKYYRVIVAPIITETNDILGFAGLIIDTTDAVTMIAEKKSFAERLIQTSEEEQRRISRDIHDSLGQILFALQLEISSAKTLLKKDVEMAEKVLSRSQEKLSTAMNEASFICYRLSPQLLADFGFVEALQDLVHTIQRSSDIKIDFTQQWLNRKKSTSLETALFRVSQEALANIMKHAKASLVRISLTETDDLITLSIADDGDGFDLQSVKKKSKRGFGLINMKERIEMMDGTFVIKTAPQSGTKIDITIPLRIKDNHA